MEVKISPEKFADEVRHLPDLSSVRRYFKKLAQQYRKGVISSGVLISSFAYCVGQEKLSGDDVLLDIVTEAAILELPLTAGETSKQRLDRIEEFVDYILSQG